MDSTAVDVDACWKDSFPEVERPELYTGQTEDEHGFLPINDSQSFSEDFTNMTTKQLHALSINNQFAMKQAQEEYLEIESVIRRLSGKDLKKDPRAPQADREYEDRHESVLYGYKYIGKEPTLRNAIADDIIDPEKRDIRHLQDPFAQGGFVPTPKQYVTKIAKAADKRNPDEWKLIQKDGKLLVPKMQEKHDEYVKHQPWTQEDIEAARAGSGDEEHTLANGTPSKPVDKRLTRTRYDGQKVPPTRDVSEDPSRAPSPRAGRAQTPKASSAHQMTPLTAAEDGSPVPKKRQRLDNITTAASSTGTSPVPTSQARPRARAGQASIPTEPLSPRSMRNWKWTSEGLLEAISKDYLWLHPDPVKALVNRDKLMTAANPVRTWSMCNKWIEWHEKGLDKRPRNKDGMAKGAESMRVTSVVGKENSIRPAIRGTHDPDNESRKSSPSRILKDSDAVLRQSTDIPSRKSSAVNIEPISQAQRANGKGLQNGGSNSVSRKNSTASIDFDKEDVKYTASAALDRRRGSAASIKPFSSTRPSRGAKRRYIESSDEDFEDEDEETLQSQADRQLLHETVEKEEKDGEFHVRTPRNEMVPSTPTRRSTRGRSQAYGS